ncbi:MAG: hypothetical protein HY663_06015 [Chloroflexi bacterium]|nr:hypothetical protein [Chloroflexota bacterium]
MRVLNYQRNRLNEALRQSEDFLMTESEIEPLTPTRLVAPYFHVSGDLDWLPVNISLASRAMQIEPASWVVVCLDSLLLDSQSLDEVIDAYSGLQTPGYLLWATDLEEERATEGQVQGLKRLITGLSQGGSKAVINMFGGYFSCLLSEDGLTGISHGLGYGERRDIVPVLGGGLPPPKYYLPPVHQGIRIDELVSIAINRDETSFRLEVCPCVICQGLLRQGVGFLLQQYTASSTKIVNGRYREVATPEVYRLTRFHYLHNKSLEFQRIRQTSREALLDALDTAYAQFRNDLGTASLMYLRTWRRALTP